jgi:hypothetical protein
LLIKGSQDQLLDTFVADLSHTIGCSQWEQRQSSNYVEERYFRCFALGLEITAAIADDSEFQNYDFWLCIEPEVGRNADKVFLAGLAECVAWKLALHGYEILRPHDSRKGSGGLIYRLNPDENAKPRERVVTEEI